jgi:hypothetical protein
VHDHPAPNGAEELKTFKPEFYPNSYQARIYFRDKKFAHLPPTTGSLNATRFINYIQRRWDPGATVTLSFKGGNDGLYSKVEQAASEWPKQANLKFNFKDDQGHYRKFTSTDQTFATQIRISFDHPEAPIAMILRS